MKKNQALSPVLPFALLCAFCALSLTACGSRDRAADEAKLGIREEPTVPNPRLQTAAFQAGSRKLTVELALTPDQQEKGLMFRKNLGEDEGMLFVFNSDQHLSFWMKNTEIPLSIAYIASDGTIRDIFDLEPRSLAPVPSTRSVRYALEVNRGWFEKAGLREGDRIQLPELP